MKRVNWIITNWYRTQIYYDSGGLAGHLEGEGGGVLLNQCPHQLDLLQWICGLPKTVQAFCLEGKWHDIEVEDDVTAYLQFENGATGVFVTTTGGRPRHQPVRGHRHPGQAGVRERPAHLLEAL